MIGRPRDFYHVHSVNGASENSELQRQPSSPLRGRGRQVCFLFSDGTASYIANVLLRIEDCQFAEEMETVDPRMLQAGPSSPPSTKLKLTIPSLKTLRERADSVKSKQSPVIETPLSSKKQRPPKLKPLKEVLAVLISKIKKCGHPLSIALCFSPGQQKG